MINPVHYFLKKKRDKFVCSSIQAPRKRKKKSIQALDKFACPNIQVLDTAYRVHQKSE